MSIRQISAFLLITITLGISLDAKAQNFKLSEYVETCPLLESYQRESYSKELDSLERSGQWVHSYNLSTSKVSDMTLSLLPMTNGTPLLILIRQLKTPQRDSYLEAYSPSWERLSIPQLLSPSPQSQNFYVSDGSVAGNRLARLLTPLYLEQSISAEGVLQIRAELAQSLEDKQDSELQALIAKLPTLRYKWNGLRFTPISKLDDYED